MWSMMFNVEFGYQLNIYSGTKENRGKPWSKSKSLYNWRSVSQSVSQSVCRGIEPTLALVARYYFLPEGCFLKVAVLSSWGTLSEVEFEVEVTLQLTVGQYVLVSSTLVVLSTRYYFLLECCWGLRSRYDWRSIGQSVSQYVLGLSPPWDLRPDINSIWISLCCLCWAPCLTRRQICLLSVTVSNNFPSSSFISFSCLFFSMAV
jgi:hypothetical protein